MQMHWMVCSRHIWSAYDLANFLLLLLFLLLLYDLAAHGVCCISSAGNHLSLHANLVRVDEKFWSQTLSRDLEAVYAYRHATLGLQLLGL